MTVEVAEHCDRPTVRAQQRCRTTDSLFPGRRRWFRWVILGSWQCRVVPEHRGTWQITDEEEEVTP